MIRDISRPDKGFTLVELLVVVAVICILLAILFPAISATREKARQAKCIANLRQSGVAIHMYFNSFDRYPPSDYARPGRLNPWQEHLLGDRHGSLRESGFNNCQKYVDTPDIFTCPSDNPHPSRITKERQDALWGTGIEFEFSYGINTFFTPG